MVKLDRLDASRAWRRNSSLEGVLSAGDLPVHFPETLYDGFSGTGNEKGAVMRRVVVTGWTDLVSYKLTANGRH